MTTIIIADDHTVVRAGLRRLLDEVPDFDVVAEAASGEEALQLARTLSPACMLIDVLMPGMGGLEATRRIVRIRPETKIIGVSTHVHGPYPLHVLASGASGYLSKSCTPKELIRAVRSVTHGQRYVNADVACNLVVSGFEGNNTPIDELSKRELEVLVMVSSAQSQSQIAERLSVSPKTVSTYRTRICRKLDVSTDVELVHLALRYGLLEGL